MMYSAFSTLVTTKTKNANNNTVTKLTKSNYNQSFDFQFMNADTHYSAAVYKILAFHSNFNWMVWQVISIYIIQNPHNINNRQYFYGLWSVICELFMDVPCVYFFLF